MDIPFCVETFLINNEQKGIISLKSNLPQKIKLSSHPPSCGGFKYSNEGDKTKDRFIIWKSEGNVLELNEYSLSLSLLKSCVRIRFNGNIIPEVVIKEFKYENGLEEIVIMVLTDESVFTLSNSSKMSLHRFHFCHPNSLQSKVFGKRNTPQSKSIFYDDDYKHFISDDISNGRETPVSVCGVNDHSIAIGTKHGSIIIVEILSQHDHQEIILKESGPILNKVFNLFQNKEHNSLVSLACERVSLYIEGREVSDYYIFAIYKDNKLRVWSVTRKLLLMVIPLSLGEEGENTEQSKLIKLMWNDKYKFTLSIFMVNGNQTFCQTFKGKIEGTGEIELQLKFISNYPEGSIVDAQMSVIGDKSYLWGLWKNNSGFCLLNTPLSVQRKNSLEMNFWQETMLINMGDEDQGYILQQQSENAPILENDVIGIYCPDDSGYLTFVVRKQNISLLREGTKSEYFSFLIDKSSKTPTKFINPLDRNVHTTLDLVASIEKEFGIEFMDSYDAKMYNLDEPYANAVQILETYLGKRIKYPLLEESGRNMINAEHFVTKVIPLFNQISNLTEVLTYFLDHIDHLQIINQEDDYDDEYFQSDFLTQDNAFSSIILDDVVFQTIRNISKSNYRILRGILFIISITKHYRAILKLSRDEHLNLNYLAKRASGTIKNTFSMVWLTTQNLSKHLLSDFQYNSISMIVNQCDYAVQFYYAVTKDKFMNLFSKEIHIKSYLNTISVLNSWSCFLPYVLSVMQIMHPDIILEDHCQYEMSYSLVHEYNQSTTIQNYIRLIDSESPYYHYLLGECYLMSSELFKATDCFMKGGAMIDNYRDGRLDYMITQFLDDRSKENWESWSSNYWKYVIDLLQKYCCYDIIVKLSLVALKSPTLTIESQDLFWSNIFQNSLVIGNFNSVYLALISNPILSRKIDCLHTFISKMSECRKTKHLLQFPFTGFEEHVDQLLMDKAKKSKLDDTPNYFEILYTFNIKRKNYGRAAMAMYEYAMKEISESHFEEESLRKRCRLLLATINALKLVDPRNAWLVVRNEQPQRPLHKRRYDHESIINRAEHGQGKLNVEIKHLKDIEKMYKKFNEEYIAMTQAKQVKR